MISSTTNQVYQLVAPRQLDVAYNNVDIYDNHVVVRPLYLSIYAAGQRYYTGRRDENILHKRLPMSLIHETAGEIAFDNKGISGKGTKVVVVPNIPIEKHDMITENHLASSCFGFSGYGGFMRDHVVMTHDRIASLPSDIDLSTTSYTELVSVSYRAIQRFKRKSIPLKTSFGIRGDDNLGYTTTILLRKLYPEARIYVFGKTDCKLSCFSFINDIFAVNQMPDDLRISHASEYIRGKGSQVAPQQVVEHTSSEDNVVLLGVSELPVEVNARLVFEKGLTLINNNRSGPKDFEQVADLYRKYLNIVEKLALLKGHEINVCTVQDIVQTFEMDLSTPWGRAVLR